MIAKWKKRIENGMEFLYIIKNPLIYLRLNGLFRYLTTTMAIKHLKWK